MSFARLLTTPCTIITLTPSGLDDYGNETVTTTEVDTYCHIEQKSTRERGADQVPDDQALAFFAADEALGHSCEVEVNGDYYELDGDPWSVIDPRTGTVHHLEVRLRKTGS